MQTTPHRGFYDGLYTPAFKDLKQCLDYPDARYVVALNYSGLIDNVRTHYERDPQAQLTLHRGGGDARNQFAALKYSPSPTAGQFLELARSYKYGPSFLAAASLTQAVPERIKIYEEAIGISYLPAYIRLGRLYRSQQDENRAIGMFSKSGDSGLPVGYWKLGETPTGSANMDLTKFMELTKAIREFL